jgi:hypothetical protein
MLTLAEAESGKKVLTAKADVQVAERIRGTDRQDSAY